MISVIVYRLSVIGYRYTRNVQRMENHDFSFENLRVYQAARWLVKDVYVIVSKLPAIENFALSSQIRRAVVSVKANLAEGSGRNHAKDKAHFVDMAYGSLMEVYSEIESAADLGYITEEEVKSIKLQIIDISKMLSGLRSSILSHDNR